MDSFIDALLSDKTDRIPDEYDWFAPLLGDWACDYYDEFPEGHKRVADYDSRTIESQKTASIQEGCEAAGEAANTENQDGSKGETGEPDPIQHPPGRMTDYEADSQSYDDLQQKD